MQAWKNVNTYLALLSVHPQAQKIPALAGMACLGPKTIAMALEYSSGSRLGKNSELHAPAVLEWLRIAGDEIERLCAEGTQRFGPGDLWTSRGGSDVCDNVRLAFWKYRLTDMGYQNHFMVSKVESRLENSCSSASMPQLSTGQSDDVIAAALPTHDGLGKNNTFRGVVEVVDDITLSERQTLFSLEKLVLHQIIPIQFQQCCSLQYRW